MKLMFSGNQLCKVNNGGCSHLCLLTPDGYQCSCPDGFFLDSHGMICLSGALSVLNIVLLKRRSIVLYCKLETGIVLNCLFEFVVNGCFFLDTFTFCF